MPAAAAGGCCCCCCCRHCQGPRECEAPGGLAGGIENTVVNSRGLKEVMSRAERGKGQNGWEGMGLTGGLSVGVGWRVGGWELGPGVGSGVVLDQGWEQGWGFGWGGFGGAATGWATLPDRGVTRIWI